MSEGLVSTEARGGGAVGARARARKLWLDLHLTIGLVTGALFVLIGLTGAISSFRAEIDEWLNADLLTLSPPAEAKAPLVSLDEIIANARAAAPEGATPVYLHFPKRRRPADVIFSIHDSASGEDRIDQIVMNPYDGSVIGRRTIVDPQSRFAEPFTVFVIHLHYTLLQGEIGETIVGFAGLFLFVSLATGLYLWWPRNGRWRQAFTVKRGASAERLVLDLHKTTAIHVLPVLVVIIFSGLYLIFGNQVRALVGVFSPVDAHMLREDLKSEPANGRAPIGAAAAASIVDRLFPDGRLMDMGLPGPEGAYVVGKRADNEVNTSEPRRRVAVDQYSGAVLQVQDPHDFTAGETFLNWQYPLHTGEAFGDPGRVFICMMGFVPALLYATGVTRWLQKRRIRQARGG
ncbi:MAG TPA: PepSY-associated TM helix domain-containing protein [Methylosinus sp.]